MRKTLAIAAATGALVFGSAGIANANPLGAPIPTATTTTLADNDNNQSDSNQHQDNSGKWGLAGLLGLAGLAGLLRRNRHAASDPAVTRAGGTAPRA